jgi:hypothetical protein
MRASVILAMIPLGIATTFLPRWPDPQPAQAETFVQRFEAVYPKHTFEERWWPGEGLPFDQHWQPPQPGKGPAIEQGSPPVDLLAPKVVRTIRITRDAVELPQEVAAVPEVVPLPEPRPSVRFKPRPIRVADICQRHGMHRVDYGKRWRCRK